MAKSKDGEKHDKERDDDAAHQPGPDPERLKIDMDFEDAIQKAMNVRRPKEGWPDKNNSSG
ncbi:MAG: hypothetical protein GC159_22480 [Phycisphaera sp.]|nr:hypothetical protein [Phycisphaera sp.]